MKTKTKQKANPLYETPDVKQLCKPDCKVCNGLGYIRYDLPVGHKLFGKVHPCPERDPLSLYNAKTTGLTITEIEKMTWEELIPTKNALQAKAAVEHVLERGHGWLFLWGDPGLAKTLSLKIAVRSLLVKKVNAAYVRMADIIEDMRRAFDTDHPNDASVSRLEAWQNLPLLAIDEFDRLRETEFARERKFVLMDERYQGALRQQSITIMASNENPELFDGYLASRIFDQRFEVVHLEGVDMRPNVEQDSLL